MLPLFKIIYHCSLSVEVLCDAVYTSIPEIPVSKIKQHWFDLVLFKMCEHIFVVVVADDGVEVLIDG